MVGAQRFDKLRGRQIDLKPALGIHRRESFKQAPGAGHGEHHGDRVVPRLRRKHEHRVAVPEILSARGSPAVHVTRGRRPALHPRAQPVHRVAAHGSDTGSPQYSAAVTRLLPVPHFITIALNPQRWAGVGGGDGGAS